MKNKNVSGFTLIEVIVALLIICIIITGFSRLVYKTMQLKNVAEDKTIIINWSQTIMEYIKNKNLAELNGEYISSDFPGLANLRDDYDGIEKLLAEVIIKINKYTDENISEGLYQINIIVKWKKEKKINIYKLSTLSFQKEV